MFLGIGDTFLQARALFAQANALVWIEPEVAFERAEQGIRLIDLEAHPRMVVCARHVQILALVGMERPGLAASLMEQTRPLYSRFPDLTLRRQWASGLIQLAGGFAAEAAVRFRRLARSFASRHVLQEQALVSLDLAHALVKQGELTEAVEVIRGIALLCDGLGLHRDVMVAVLVLESEVKERTEESIAAFATAAEAIRRKWSWRPEHGSSPS